MSDIDFGKLANAVRLINSFGAFVGMALPSGTWTLSPDEMVEVVRDSDAFLAKYHKISRDRFVAWRNYDGQCTGTTKNGHRCKGAGPSTGHPIDFVPGESDRCVWHLDVGASA